MAGSSGVAGWTAVLMAGVASSAVGGVAGVAEGDPTVAGGAAQGEGAAVGAGPAAGIGWSRGDSCVAAGGGVASGTGCTAREPAVRRCNSSAGAGGASGA